MPRAPIHPFSDPQVLKGTYDPLPSEYSEELRSVIGLMLTRDVNKRPTTNDVLQVGCGVHAWGNPF